MAGIIPSVSRPIAENLVEQAITEVTPMVNHQQNIAAPAFNATRLVDINLLVGRWVVGSLRVQPTGANAASIICEVETNPGSGIYDVVQEARIEAAASPVETRFPFSFFVPAGRNYRFGRGALAGVTEALSNYNYSEF